MIRSVSRRPVRVLSGIAAAIVLSGCSAATDARGAGTGPGMMGGDTAYHYSSLTCAAPPLPGSTVKVLLGDMGMTQMMGGTAPVGVHMMLRALPAAVPAGQVSFIASNVGWRTHELVILPLGPGTVTGQRVPSTDGKVDEAGSLGEASGSCASGTGEGITSGTVGWVTVTLAPGRYELLCNLPNHYTDGMRQELVVS